MILQTAIPPNFIPSWSDSQTWFESAYSAVVTWLSQPHILAIIIAWAATFTIICILILCLGFGPVGVGAVTLAAAFQSYMYGAFTPAGGVFATLTSMAMLGTLMPAAALFAFFVASGVAVISCCMARDAITRWDAEGELNAAV
ncbi:hypothetical protein NQ176_g8649 [Zarea fungicola]|uniref:Uncharacterized protein n=1 Tax=Zarea fungicola TaxID=93591 RepID=A0ACC1MTD1_9HYPO|nr:hypothetical protein NQ176_g8649 [Lecanicillium fungicola]